MPRDMRFAWIADVGLLIANVGPMRAFVGYISGIRSHWISRLGFVRHQTEANLLMV